MPKIRAIGGSDRPADALPHLTEALYDNRHGEKIEAVVVITISDGEGKARIRGFGKFNMADAAWVGALLLGLATSSGQFDEPETP